MATRGYGIVRDPDEIKVSGERLMRGERRYLRGPERKESVCEGHLKPSGCTVHDAANRE